MAANPQSLKRDGIQMEMITVTPAQAEIWLQGHSNYRPLRKSYVAVLADDMRQGRWDEDNGTSIVFDKDGLLIDGQHRLHACILAKTPFRTLVVRGAKSEAVITIDVGAKRSLGDYLHSLGYANPNVLAACLRLVHGWEKGGVYIGFTSMPSRKVLLEVLARHPELPDFTCKIRALRELTITDSVASTLHYLFTRASDKESADRFFAELGKGEYLGPVDPVYHLRRRLQKEPTAKAKLTNREKTALIIKAWNAWVSGKEIKSLQWNSVGPNSEAFPEIASGDPKAFDQDS